MEEFPKKTRSFAVRSTVYGFLLRTFSIQVSDPCDARLPVVRSGLRHGRYVRGVPPAGFPQRRDHPFVVRRDRDRLLFRAESDCRRVLFRGAVGVRDRSLYGRQTDPRGFGDRPDLVARHGRRDHLRIPDAGIRSEPDEFPVREYTERHLLRPDLDGDRRPGDRDRFRRLVPADLVRGFRPGVCPQPEYADAVDRLPDVGADRRDDRHFDPRGGDRSADLAADHARGDRQPADPLVRTDHGRGFGDRRARFVRRALCQLQGRYSVGRVYNIYTDPYAYYCKTITFA